MSIKGFSFNPLKIGSFRNAVSSFIRGQESSFNPLKIGSFRNSNHFNEKFDSIEFQSPKNRVIS